VSQDISKYLESSL